MKDARWAGAFEAIKAGFQAIPKNLEFTVIYVLANIVSSVQHVPALTIIGFAISLAVLLAFTKYSLATARGHKLPVAKLFAGTFDEYFNIIAAFFLFLGLLFVSIFGLLIPLIWFVPWTTFMLYIIIDQHLGVMDAFRASRKLAKDHKAQVWAIVGVAVMFAVLSVILFSIPGLGWLAGAVISSLIGLATSTACARLYFYLKAD